MCDDLCTAQRVRGTKAAASSARARTSRRTQEGALLLVLEMRAIIVLAGLVLAASSGALALQVPASYRPSAALATWQNGTATFFGGPQDGLDTLYNATLPAGSCGYGPVDMRLWPFHGVVGVAPSSLIASARPQHGCGTCLAVKCIDPTPKACRVPFTPGGSTGPATNDDASGGAVLRVMVVDTCPSCAANTLNLHAFGFEEIARTRFGSVQVAFKQVPCDPPEGVYVRVDAWDKAGWLRLSVSNAEGDGGLTNVSIRAAATPPPPSAHAPTPSSTAAAATGSSARTHSTSTITAPTTTSTRPAAGDAAATDDPMSLLVTRGGPLSNQTDDGAGWVPMNNTYGAAWEVGALPSPAPHGWDLKVVDVTGAHVIVRNAVPPATSAQQLLHTFTFPDQLLPSNKTTLAQLLTTGQGPTAAAASPAPAAAAAVGASRRELLHDAAAPPARAPSVVVTAGSPAPPAPMPLNAPPPAGPAAVPPPPPAPQPKLVRAPLIIPEDIPVVQAPNGTQVRGTAPSAAPAHLGTNVIVDVPREGQGTWLPGMDVGMARPPTMPSPSPPPPSASSGDAPPSAPPGGDGDEDCECRKKKKKKHHRPPSPPCPES